MLMQLVQVGALLLLPALNAAVVDRTMVRGDTAVLGTLGVALVAAAIVQLAASVGIARLSARTAAALGRDLRSAVFRRVNRFSAREIGRFGASTLLTRTVNDVQQIQTFTQAALINVLSGPVVGIGAVILATTADLPVAAVLLAPVPILTVLCAGILTRTIRGHQRVQRTIDRMNRLFSEQISGVRVVRAFVREEHESERFAATNTELRILSLRAGQLVSMMYPAILLVVNVFSVALVWLGGYRAGAGALSVGELNASLGYLGLMLLAFLMAMLTFLTLPRASVGAARIREVLDTTSSVAAPTDPVTWTPSPGVVELRAVTFHYPEAEEPVLRDIDLAARPGETVALIGNTGSGKTTLLSLILRLADATAGRVSVGGVDVRDLEPDLLRRTVAVVPQRPQLFSGTVASNLRFGRPDAGDDELWHYLEVAQAADFVRRLSGGLAADVHQGGQNFSGGQRQRLSIARALIHRPAVYLFDDCFSALDFATDAALRAALAPATAAATVIMVAQRVSVIRSADRILVLDGGRCAATGTHPELMRTSPVYREIALSQLSEEEAA